jgi:hypothetical protein
MLSMSQTENWYIVSGLVAEFWSAVSSLLIVVVGVWHASLVAITAGTLSFASHAISSKAAHWLDFVGIAMIGIRVAVHPEAWTDHHVHVSTATAAMAFAARPPGRDTRPRHLACRRGQCPPLL